MAKAKSNKRKTAEDQDVLKYLKSAEKEAQRNVTHMQKIFRRPPAPSIGYWREQDMIEMNRYYRAERSAQRQAVRLANAQRDVMSGRTVDAGTRSMLEGLRSFIRGGGGSNLRGK